MLTPCPSPGPAGARSPLWCRQPWGRRCGSPALATPLGPSTPGGRKMGSPSPLTGVCSIPPGGGRPLGSPLGREGPCGAPEPRGLGGGQAHCRPREPRTQAPILLTEVQAAARRLLGHQPPAGRGCWYLQLRQQARPRLSEDPASRHRSLCPLPARVLTGTWPSGLEGVEPGPLWRRH